ncbi:MAG: 30S ribosomal protein S13 [Elusimicrobiota bacterium]
MARIAGLDLPPHKRVDVALTYLYGIGRRNVSSVLEAAQVPPDVRVKNLTEIQLSAINGVLAKDFKVEGELRREVEASIRRYIDIGSYLGQRHRRNLPVRGQRTKTNARTRRGMRKTVGSVKPGIKKTPGVAGAETSAKK